MYVLDTDPSAVSRVRRSNRIEVDHALFIHCALHRSIKDLRQALIWTLMTLDHPRGSPYSTAFALR